MTFSKALKEMQKNERLMQRGCWASAEYVGVYDSADNSDMTQPYLFINTLESMYPWSPSQEDLFATDWEFFDE
tara:strand:- start:2270 stop:2488 length:219 start_codon:yes stop_codon:yes gene_type:complete